MRWKFAPIAAITAALLFTACPSRRNEVAKPLGDVTSDTAGATNPASPGGTALVPETNAGTTVLITMNDSSIVVTNPDAIPPGPAIFTVTNISKNVHNLFVDGPGVQRAPDTDLPAGKTTSFDVPLQAGSYTLYCPVLDHRTKGETAILIVRPANAPAPTSTVVTPPPTDTRNVQEPGNTATSESKTKP